MDDSPEPAEDQEPRSGSFIKDEVKQEAVISL